MSGRPSRKCAVVLVMVFGILGSVPALPVQGQPLSDVDTMQIVDVSALPGDTVAVDFYLHNAIVLGGYNFRLRYDPLVIEPLTDTVLSGVETTLVVEAQQLRGTGFELFGGGVRFPGVMTFMAAEIRLLPGTLFLPGSGVAVRMRWRVLPGALAESTTIDFESDPVNPQSFNTIADIDGLNFRRPVLVSGLFEILTCSCGSQGDINANGIAFDVIDVMSLIGYAFRGASAPPKDASCYHVNRGEITCDGVVDVRDVVEMIDVMIGVHPPTCDPCACSPYPGGCP